MSVTNPLTCLSVLELLEARENADEIGLAHVRNCLRCSTLMKLLPKVDSESLAHASEPRSHLSLPMRPLPAQPTEMKSGQIWSAAAVSEWRQPVVVVGRSRTTPEWLIVIPLTSEVELATDLDVRIDEENPLGYPVLANVWNHGYVMREQLRDYYGELNDEDRAAVLSLYNWVVLGGERPDVAAGIPLAGVDDERAVLRALEIDRLRALWRPVSQAQEPPDDEEGSESAGEIKPTPATGSLGVYLAHVLAGEEWDAAALVEVAAISRDELDRFLTDHLDLTYASDANSVAKVIKALHVDVDEAETLVMRSLDRSPGGTPVGSDFILAAARTRPHVTADQLRKDLFRDHVEVDESPSGRQKAAAHYWQAVAELLDS